MQSVMASQMSGVAAQVAMKKNSTARLMSGIRLEMQMSHRPANQRQRWCMKSRSENGDCSYMKESILEDDNACGTKSIREAHVYNTKSTGEWMYTTPSTRQNQP
jgi:hypothetical protein